MGSASEAIKRCFKCNEAKPLSAFYRHPQMGDGHIGKCKECAKVDVSENYRKNRDHYIAYEAKREQDPERRKRKNVYGSRLRARNPIKAKAWSLTGSAISCGRLTPQPCEVCEDNPTEAHHDDYSKPLDVRWLCRVHHLEFHGKVAY